ncbi:fructosamine kinase family protein [Sediminibacillus massiliensis]|nr:fructosamine kinase family protein [Sediminibacillus massiliensis]
MRQIIGDRLSLVGDESGIEEIRQVSGGDINQAFYVQTKEQEYFIKGNKNVPSHFFRVEAKGLAYIRDTHTVKVPKVFYYDEPASGEDGVLIMDWITGTKTSQTTKQLGEELAHMHQNKHSDHGFEENTFVGTLGQPNGFYKSWPDYYRQRRLEPQIKCALDRGLMPPERRKKTDKLLDRLGNGNLLPDPSPSLLHGDLWGGNWIAGPAGDPYLIDPSVLFGDPCFDMALTELFGGFPADFYQAYKSVLPFPDYYEEIKPLYQLFYLFVHLNMFGETYGSSVDRVLGKFT